MVFIIRKIEKGDLAEKPAMVESEDEWVNPGGPKILKNTDRTGNPFPEQHGNHSFHIYGNTFTSRN